MTKKSRQKFKYLENEKNFQDEIKSIFHHFKKAFIEENKNNFVWMVRSDFKIDFNVYIFPSRTHVTLTSSINFGDQKTECGWQNR